MRWTLGTMLILAFSPCFLLAQKDADRPSTAKANSPEEAYSVYFKAAASQDLKTQIAVLSPKMIDYVAATKIHNAVFGEYDTSADELKRVRKQLDVLVQHGLTLEGDLRRPTLAGLTAEEQRSAQDNYANSLVAKAKDKVGLILKLHDLRHESEKQMERKMQSAFLNAKLEELKVEGDLAVGLSVLTIDGKTRKIPIRFRKNSDGWRIDK